MIPYKPLLDFYLAYEALFDSNLDQFTTPGHTDKAAKAFIAARDVCRVAATAAPPPSTNFDPDLPNPNLCPVCGHLWVKHTGRSGRCSHMVGGVYNPHISKPCGCSELPPDL